MVDPNQMRTNTRATGPVLTDAEMEAKYQYIYDKYRTAEPSPTINFTFVVLLVMTGLTIVLAIPYFLLRKKGKSGGSGGSISSSFAQMLQQSRKKSVSDCANRSFGLQECVDATLIIVLHPATQYSTIFPCHISCRPATWHNSLSTSRRRLCAPHGLRNGGHFGCCAARLSV